MAELDEKMMTDLRMSENIDIGPKPREEPIEFRFFMFSLLMQTPYSTSTA